MDCHASVVGLPDWRLILAIAEGLFAKRITHMTQSGYFDLATVALLRDVLDDAWASIPAKRRASMLKTTLAERILAAAADGERDPDRLREAALAEMTAEKV